MGTVLGLDGCKRGWIGMVLSTSSSPAVVFGASFEEAVAAARALDSIEVIAVDIPIGLPESGPRQADALARKRLGARSSSVFSTPIRACLEAETYADANRISKEIALTGVTQQAYALRAKIMEVDHYLPSSSTPIVEVHPEVAFAQMSGAPVAWSKKTWAGLARRRQLLADQGITLPDDIGDAGCFAAPDDVLDAAAAAWVAMHHARGNTVSLPSPPEPMSQQASAAIWICASLD